MIFEKGSPKGIFRQNMNNGPKWSLSQDSQCYQGGALKYVLGDLCEPCSYEDFLMILSQNYV